MALTAYERLLLAATAGGGHRASFDLGALFAHRLGDPVTAAHWFLRAAKEGSAPAWRELELLVPRLRERPARWYRDGFGGPVDLVQALRWCLSMLAAGSGDGIHEAHEFVRQMTDDQIHEAGRLAGRLLDADVFVAGRRFREQADARRGQG